MNSISTSWYLIFAKSIFCDCKRSISWKIWICGDEKDMFGIVFSERVRLVLRMKTIVVGNKAEEKI